jgi:hypothetical protein
MSTDYRSLSKVSVYDLFDGRVEKHGVREHIKEDETNDKKRCLTDGRNYMWVYIDDECNVGSLTRYGANAPSKILHAIAQVFDTDIVSEYEPQFWGFETQEEWDAYMERLSRESDDRFYAKLVKYLRGEPCDIEPGTIGMRWAEVAKTLVDKDESLLLPENKDKLLKMVQSYGDEHRVIVTLTPEEKASVQMVCTHEDDLPRA